MLPPAALRDRLASLGRGAPPGRRSHIQRPLPQGFEAVETPYGVAWRLLDVLPVGRVPGLLPAVQHAYLDTETTGLSGGTGTQVFAAAVCRPISAGLELAQLFLPDPAGEAAFLSLLQSELAEGAGLATYNGSRFDLPLLRTRWVMARLPGDLHHAPHVDLLNLTRALLRQRLVSCSLGVVEERVLGFEREGDLRGALVPEAYFRYLRAGSTSHLELALEHNRQDALSLFHLHARLLLRLAGEDLWMEGQDWLALGRHLLRHGRRADGWRALRNAVEFADGPSSALAGLLLARGLASRGRHRAAERVLAALQQSLPQEVSLAVGRARLLERELQEPEAARDVVASMLDRLPGGSPHRTDLERRLKRLELRVARRQLPQQAARERRRRLTRQQDLFSEC